MSALTVEPYATDIEVWRAEIEAKRQRAQRFKLLDLAVVEAENRPVKRPPVNAAYPIADLIRMYRDEGKTTVEIGAIIGRSARTVQQRLSDAGALRSKSEASTLRQPKGHKRKPTAQVPLETLTDLYVTQELTAGEVAERVGISRSAVNSRLTRAGLMRTRGEARQVSMRKGRMAWMK